MWKQLSSILLIALLAVSATSFNIITASSKLSRHGQPNDDRVTVDFYYESLCPYCQQFIVGSLKTAANTKDFWKICNFNLYPYGNAKRSWNGATWDFTCQHGVRECEGNIIETCALKLNANQFETKALPFIICLESSTSDWTAQGKKCATQVGISWDNIAACTKSKQGNDWQVEYAVATEKLVPAHTYVPWAVVNNQHTSSSESAVISNMVRYVCSIYKGSVKIDACK